MRVKRRTRFTVYVTKISAEKGTRDLAAWRTPVYQNEVLAHSRLEAVNACQDEIWPLIDPEISIVAVYCGKKGSITGAANRLEPHRIRR